MDQKELTQELEVASRLASGTVTEVYVLIHGKHYEIRNVIPIRDTISLEAGEEVEAPVELGDDGEDVVDPSDAIDAAEQYDRRRHPRSDDDPRHLRIAEDQPAQERP